MREYKKVTIVYMLLSSKVQAIEISSYNTCLYNTRVCNIICIIFMQHRFIHY